MILLSLILLLSIGTMPDLHSSSESDLKTQAEKALATLNAALPAEAEKLRLSDFNATGQRDLALNIRCPANELARVILNHHQSGYFGGDGYYTALTGNNHSSAGNGERGAYLNVVAQLKKIRDAAPPSMPMRKLMDTTTPLATLHPTALPQPAPSHPAAGATSTTSGHTRPLNTASGATPAPSELVPPAHATDHTTPATPPAQPMGPQETPLQKPNTEPQPAGSTQPLHTAPAPSATVPPAPATDHTTPVVTPTTPIDPQRAPLPGADTEPQPADSTQPLHTPHEPLVMAPSPHREATERNPTLPTSIRTRIPHTKIQKGAIGGGFLTTAAGLAWLFTLLAQKESREDIKLFWGKLFSKKTRAAVATRAARIRSEIKRHGNESIGALTTTLAGLGLLLYGGTPRYQKNTSHSEETK